MIIMKPMFKFDEKNHYGDYVIVTDFNPVTNEVDDGIVETTKKLFREQIDKLIPKRLQHKITWETKHHEAETIKVKDDNYEQMGMTPEDIGRIIDIEEHWTIGWKYSPKTATAAFEQG